MAFLHLRKRAAFVDQVYKKQRSEKIRQELMHTKTSLLHCVHERKNLATVKNFATHELGMHPIVLGRTTAVRYT